MRAPINLHPIMKIGGLASVAAILLAANSAHAQTTTEQLARLNGREYVRLCALSQNSNPCLGAVYGGATVNRLLDKISDQRTFCPPPAARFPPTDIVSTLSAWLQTHPAFLDKPALDGLSEALKAMYPCH